MGTTTSGNVTWLPAKGSSLVPAKARRVRPHLPGLAAMWRAITTRRLLAGMDDRMLADIGVSRGDAMAEADRRPWDLQPR